MLLPLDGAQRTCWLDEVEEHVDSVIAESRVTLDSALFGQNVVVLPLQEGHYLVEGSLVVNAIAEAGCIDDGQRHASAFLIKFQLDSHGLDLDAFLDVCGCRVISVHRLQDLAPAEGIDKGGSASA